MLADLQLPVTLTVRTGSVLLRRATVDDADAIITLLADDPISAARGDVASDVDRERYERGLAEVLTADGNDQLVVEREGAVIGMFQLTRIPGVSRRGATRVLVEAVRVRTDLRSDGIGSAMMRWVSDVAAPALDAQMVQLTSDAARVDAHRFYERLGYVGSHRGFKLSVPAH
ncbi:GNAT family N-acetyltransferase [Microbacterium pseudoresistens]|uniref:GNAT superfamily N-acetyltransferase n=1 Tax=Microbacterium pseudoresistens TaxID=640634 RepID=A0A7Y9ETF2_9MICO|nr:GNAT family N-acetyltransferase [Microbacterium pseudoresistens]NYD53531.1 GNAT superfamily N-acetyltransferase [Microbacterium pseudoresistens]